MIVVGAGVSGLRAASELQRAGAKVTSESRLASSSSLANSVC